MRKIAMPLNYVRFAVAFYGDDLGDLDELEANLLEAAALMHPVASINSEVEVELLEGGINFEYKNEREAKNR